MSENLKRAESLFNRIMNQNGDANSFAPKSHYALKTATTNGPKPKQPIRARPEIPPLVLPKRDPVAIAQEACEKVPPNHHVLPYCWTIWFHMRGKVKREELEESGPAAIAEAVDLYLQTTNEVSFPNAADNSQTTTRIASLEQMWWCLLYMKKTYELRVGTEFLIFKSGVHPVWEDPVNLRGGRWVFRFSGRRGQLVGDDASTIAAPQFVNRQRSCLVWERLVMRAMLGLLGPDVMRDVVGLVLSVRKDDDIISIWNLNAGMSKANGFQARRMVCDAVLEVVRECDQIIAGEDAVRDAGNAGGGGDRVPGVLFEYRMHAENSVGEYRQNKYSNGGSQRRYSRNNRRQ